MTEDGEDQLELENQMTPPLSDKDITKLIKQCGTFGPYQRLLYTYIIIIGTLSIMPPMNLAFISANVPFLCYPPNFNASTVPANLTENEYLEMLQPDDDQCSVYNNSFTGTYYTTPPINSSKLQCSYGRKFLTENFSTIVSEFDLVCERKWGRSTLQSIYFAGCLFGAIVFGVLPDRDEERRKIRKTADSKNSNNRAVMSSQSERLTYPNKEILAYLRPWSAKFRVLSTTNTYNN